MARAGKTPNGQEDMALHNGDRHLTERITTENGFRRVDARGIYYRDLNAILKNLNDKGVKKIELLNVCGQRYIGTNLDGNPEIKIHGIPGNDLGAFMKGPSLIVYGNAQDGCGNTMDDGRIVIHGDAGDIVGHSMRGGKIFVRGDVGYRVGIHMKEYGEKKPILVVGGTAQDFLGEYMAGGILVVLGLTLKDGEEHKARFVGTGMHGGKMYIHGKVTHLGREVEIAGIEDSDRRLLHSIISEYCNYFDFDTSEVMTHDFAKVIPITKRPYGKLYAH